MREEAAQQTVLGAFERVCREADIWNTVAKWDVVTDIPETDLVQHEICNQGRRLEWGRAIEPATDESYLFIRFVSTDEVDEEEGEPIGYLVEMTAHDVAGMARPSIEFQWSGVAEDEQDVILAQYIRGHVPTERTWTEETYLTTFQKLLSLLQE